MHICLADPRGAAGAWASDGESNIGVEQQRRREGMSNRHTLALGWGFVSDAVRVWCETPIFTPHGTTAQHEDCVLDLLPKHRFCPYFTTRDH
eukprot:7017245-Prymnesium_polylepis.2